MNQHTPGPWIVWVMQDGSDGILPEDHLAGQQIQTVIARVHHASVKVQGANARLIAKAPEMLQLLQAIGTFTVAARWQTGAISKDLVAGWIEEARNLLREIKGERP